MDLSKATDGLSGKGPMYLMSKDSVVAAYNLDKNIVKIINFNLLPFGLRHNSLSANDIEEWLKLRVLSLSRSNADKITEAIGIEKTHKLKLAGYCRALSLTDCFWVKSINSRVKWVDVNLYHNSLSKAIADAALVGKHVSIQGRAATPEITGKGGYAKCWRRINGNIYLLKLGVHSTPNEAEIEVLCSDILDHLDIAHVKYELYYTKNMKASKCQLLTSEDIGICNAYEYEAYCNMQGINFNGIMEHTDDYLKMLIVDYLIWNTDRHGENWGITFDINTGKELGLHPLLDHNNCLVWNKEKGDKSMTKPNLTLESAARIAKSRVYLSTDKLLVWAVKRDTEKKFNSVFHNKTVYSQFKDRIIKYRKW